MICKTLHALVLMAGSSALLGQARSDGLATLRVKTVGISSFFTLRGNVLSWSAIDASYPLNYGSLAMPFDIPGAIVTPGDGQAICSGRDSVGGNGILARVQLSAGQAGGVMQVLDSVSVGAIDPELMELNRAEGVLYVMDTTASKVYVVDWPGWQPIGSLELAVDVSSLTPVLLNMRLARDPGESSDGVYLENGIEEFYRDIYKKVHLHKVSGSWVLDDVTPIRSAPQLPGISVRDPLLLSSDGPIQLACFAGGNFLVERASDGLPVMSGSLFPGGFWQTFSVPPGAFVAGEAYRVVGLGMAPTNLFRPTLRWGQAMVLGDYAMGRGYFRSPHMRVDNAEFSVWGRIDWAGLATPPVVDIPYFLTVAFEQNGVSPVTTLPGGQVVLSNPVGSLFGEDWTPPEAPPQYCQLTATLPIPDDSGLEGLGLLFQWVAFDAAGGVFVSDVFGGRVLPSGSSALRQAASGNGPQLNAAARMALARQWLRGCCSPVATARVLQAFHALQAGH